MKSFKSNKNNGSSNKRRSLISVGTAGIFGNPKRQSLKNIMKEFSMSVPGVNAQDSEGSNKAVPVLGYPVVNRSGSIGSNKTVMGPSFASSNPESKNILTFSADSIYFNSIEGGNVTNLVLSFNNTAYIEKSDTPVENNSMVVTTLDSSYTFFGFADFELAYSHIISLFAKYNARSFSNPMNMLKTKKKPRPSSTSNFTRRSHKPEPLKTVNSSLKLKLSPTSTMVSAEDPIESTYDPVNSDSDVQDSVSEKSETLSDPQRESEPSPTQPEPEPTPPQPESAPAPPIVERTNFGYPKIEHLQNQVIESTVNETLPLVSRMLFFGLSFPLGPYSKFMGTPINNMGVINDVRKSSMIQEGLLDITIGKWKNDPPAVGDEINVNYIRPLNLVIGPKQTRSIEKFKLVSLDPENYLVVEGTSSTPDVPSGGSFVVKSLYSLERVDKSPSSTSTLIKISTTVEWSKKSWLKSKIEQGALAGIKTSSQLLVENVSRPKKEAPVIEKSVKKPSPPPSVSVPEVIKSVDDVEAKIEMETIEDSAPHGYNFFRDHDLNKANLSLEYRFGDEIPGHGIERVIVLLFQGLSTFQQNAFKKIDSFGFSSTFLISVFVFLFLLYSTFLLLY
ncbi:putative membrane protein [Smittium mucronatum]|uniref:Putative membrane protein n=1 Tax=Smittium mucronatum TaxID=133383 RepID=A0A1R0GRH6_9FUNG|nr:putative membrane protein [Smittium mucronatum]